MVRSLVFLVFIVSLTSCYRTHYVNFSPQNPERSPSVTAGPPVRAGSGWRSFFIWGWVPGEMEIDAQKQCGGSENLDSVQTRRTFLEGLVAAFAGFYINIYSPWDGAVYCRSASSE